jgi:hypothetical protein
MTGPVQRAIIANVHEGDRFSTPTGRGAFIVNRIDDSGIVLLLAERWHTRLSWECLEGVLGLLAAEGWIPIGSQYEVEGTPGTLDAYLKKCIKRATAGWVAVVLERAGILTIDRSRPAKVRLRTGLNAAAAREVR